MKKLLLILLCLPMIGCFDTEEELEIKKAKKRKQKISLENFLKELEEETVLRLNQEELARENFLMKKDSEDVVLIRTID